MVIYNLILTAIIFANFSTAISQFNLPSSYAKAVEAYLNNSNSNDSAISLNCRKQLDYYVTELLEQKRWALELFDANGQLPSGILSGNLFQLGSFDQCLDVKDNNSEILGQYCMGSLKIPNFFNANISRDLDKLKKKDISLGICIPSGCSADEISDVLIGIGYDIKVSAKYCQVKSKTVVELPAILTLSLFAVILCLMLISSSYDVFLHYTEKDCKHPLLLAFSMLKNGKALFQTGKNPGQISCLNGIRVFATMWIVLLHLHLRLQEIAVTNSVYMNKWLYSPEHMFLLSSPIAVDTFLLLGGLLVAYSYLKSQTKHVKFNIGTHYLHRYLRLTPVVATIVLIYSTLFHHLGSGPLWSNWEREKCIKCWWQDVFYLQNYFMPFNKPCVSQIWYLCVDMHLFVLSPLILIPLMKRPKTVIIAVGSAAIVSIVATFVSVWIHQFSALRIRITNSQDASNYWIHYATSTHTRASPWLLGIILGYMIFKHSTSEKQIHYNKMLMILLWVLSFAVMYCCIFPAYNMLIRDTENRLENSMLAALRHPAWAIAIGWMIFSCVTGYGGPINWFLSLPLFEVLSRFTYGIYMIHCLIIWILHYQARTSIEFSDTQLMNNFCVDFIYSMGASALMVLAIEMPVATIEKHFLQ